MPKLPTSLVSNVTRSSAENKPTPAIRKIAAQNSQASMQSNTVKTLGDYLMTKAGDFAHYVDKLMSTDKQPRNFVSVELSDGKATSYKIYGNPPFRMSGHKFTDLKIMHNHFPAGVEMSNCWFKATEDLMKWGDVSFSHANLAGIKIDGGLEGSQSCFDSIGFSSVNLQDAEINDVKFTSGDAPVFSQVDLSKAKFNNVSFKGCFHSICEFSRVNLTGSGITDLTLSYVDFLEKVNITGNTIKELLVTGPCDWSGLECDHYSDGAISWNRKMFDNAEGLNKSLSPENGAIVLNMLNTMKKNNGDIVVDLMRQMTEIIMHSPALVECYRNEPLLRALIAELRDPLYAGNKDIQEFRDKLLFQHYRRAPLNPGEKELAEARGLLSKLPVEKLLQVQVVVNQVAREYPQIWSRFSEHRDLADLSWLRKINGSNIPHLFFNPETWEIICLSKMDFEGLVTSNTPPRNPEQIKCDVSGKNIKFVAAEQGEISRLRSALPLVNRLWERATMSLQMVINGLFTSYSYSDLSVEERMEAGAINHHTKALLAQPYGKKLNLTFSNTAKMLKKVFSSYCGHNSQQSCTALVKQAQQQLENHPSFQARPRDQQHAIAALVMVKVLLELSTKRYYGTESSSVTAFHEPASHIFWNACKACPGMFNDRARIGWYNSLSGPGLQHPEQVAGLLSEINQYQFHGPDGAAIKAAFDAVYPLPQ
ncbi:MAG: hypothetical protein PW844_09720 [Pantoea sp.]|uniref:pentapeptide repeat-containing protein n=1 Tax=Pantoea sp. TaxID=69393 RepID=UPI00239379AD|nr:hypothetical protein [Pantoea sp.]MDE1186744.1 hypothetical protein [Pantoea sp.]